MSTQKKCAREGCQSPVEGNTHRRYCSKACSAATRNRRYYLTLRGRTNKRAGQSRYFQKHRRELYEKRRARMEGYVAAILRKGEVDAVDGRLQSTRRGLQDQEYTLLAARNLARVRYDWHPNAYDGPMGRPIYRFTSDGRAFLTNSGESWSPFVTEVAHVFKAELEDTA